MNRFIETWLSFSGHCYSGISGLSSDYLDIPHVDIVLNTTRKLSEPQRHDPVIYPANNLTWEGIYFFFTRIVNLVRKLVAISASRFHF